MCNTRTITYSCTHVVPFRLSTCRGTFTYETRKHASGTLPSCRSGPQITFRSTQPCGACTKTAAENDLEAKISALRLQHTPETDDWAAEPPEALITAEAELESDKWRLTKAYPDVSRFRKGERPEKGPPATRSESLLRREVVPEDVVLKLEMNKTAIIGTWDYESWGDDWKDLGAEIAEADQELVAANLPAFTDCSFDCCDEEGPQMEMPEEEVILDMDWGTATSGILELEDVWKPEETNVDTLVAGQETDSSIKEKGLEESPVSEPIKNTAGENQVPVFDSPSPKESQEKLESETTKTSTRENKAPVCKPVAPERSGQNLETKAATSTSRESGNSWAPHRRLRRQPSMENLQKHGVGVPDMSRRPSMENRQKHGVEVPYIRRRPSMENLQEQGGVGVPDNIEPFKAHGPFFMEFAVSV